jgi:hypothetical protein
MRKASQISVVMGVFLAAAVAASAQIPLLNTSFESPVADGSEPAPDNWGFFTSGPNSSGVSSNIARTGGQSLIFFAPPDAGDANSFQGYAQGVTLAVGTSDTITFSGYFRADAGLPLAANAIGKLGIEFHRANNSEINRVELQILPGDLSTSEWRLFSVSGSPNGEAATSLGFTLVEVNGDAPNSGIFYVDDVAAVPEPTTFSMVALALGAVGVIRRMKRVSKR